MSKENSVITEELVSSNLLYFQKIVWPKNTNPRKKGITPNKNTNRLLQDLAKVADIKFKLGLYYKYFSIVIHANMTPKPTNSYLSSKIVSLYSIPNYRIDTTAPMT